MPDNEQSTNNTQGATSASANTKSKDEEQIEKSDYASKPLGPTAGSTEERQSTNGMAEGEEPMDTAGTNTLSDDEARGWAYYNEIKGYCDDAKFDEALASNDADQIDKATKSLVLDLQRMNARNALQLQLDDLAWRKSCGAFSESTDDAWSSGAGSSRGNNYRAESAYAITHERPRSAQRPWSLAEALADHEKNFGKPGTWGEFAAELNRKEADHNE